MTDTNGLPVDGQLDFHRRRLYRKVYLISDLEVQSLPKRGKKIAGNLFARLKMAINNLDKKDRVPDAGIGDF